MSQFVGMMPVIVIAFMVATAATLLVGVFAMGKGGDFNRKWGNKLMRLRVILQGIAVILAALFAVLAVSS